MEFEDLLNLGWRWGLIAIVALLALYLVIAILRMRRLRLEKSTLDLIGELSAQTPVHTAVAAYAEAQDPITSKSNTKKLSYKDFPEHDFPWNEPPLLSDSAKPVQYVDPRPEPLGLPPIEPVTRDTITVLEHELSQVRKEVGTLRAEILVLREAQERDVSRARAAQHTAPVYSDAMQMAIQGKDAAGISQHCGISRAEAELVVALVRNRDA